MRVGILLVLATACGGGQDDHRGGVDAPADGHDAQPIDAASIDAASFPAVCQQLPLSCPDAASLALCEANNAAAFGTCSFLPITTGCAGSSCPSQAQICRTAESAAGYCTHACVDNQDCAIAGGGTGTCTTINGAVHICTVP